MNYPLKSALFLKFSENFRIFTYFDVIFEILVKFSGRGAFRDGKESFSITRNPRLQKMLTSTPKEGRKVGSLQNHPSFSPKVG